MSGTHMVCMYGKILTSILRIDVYMILTCLSLGLHVCLYVASYPDSWVGG